VVAFQHAILYSVSGGDGLHQHTNFDASAISPRESAHAFYAGQWTRILVETVFVRLRL